MTRRVLSKIKYYVRLFGAGDRGALWSDTRRWIWSDDHAYGMSRDLRIPHPPPQARLAFTVQRLSEDLAEVVFDVDGVPPAERRELLNRRRFWDEGLGTAYVAVDADGHPCYVQWTIPGLDADRIDSFFGGGFPHLGPNDMLLEGAWTLPTARGQRLMSEAMSRITEAGAGPEHRRAVTFVGVDNEPSLRGCRSAGFEVYVERLDTWRFGRRRVQWMPVAATEPEVATPS
jgi:RimJ/RimL family protein N-acetyltransferase